MFSPEMKKQLESLVKEMEYNPIRIGKKILTGLNYKVSIVPSDNILKIKVKGQNEILFNESMNNEQLLDSLIELFLSLIQKGSLND